MKWLTTTVTLSMMFYYALLDAVKGVNNLETVNAKNSELIEKIQNYLDSPDYEGNLHISEPLSIDELEAVEGELGFRLPTLLRDLYIQVGNGGFGPGYGILGLKDGWADDEDRSAFDLYQELFIENPQNPQDYYWPDKLLPICDWGCAIYSCLDCTREDGPIWTWERGELRSVSEASSLNEWLENWLKRYEPTK
jgi:hypothetical protein